MAGAANTITLKEAADLIGARLVGDGGVVVRGVAPIADAAADQVTFLANERYRAGLKSANAAAVIIGAEGDLPMAQLVVKSPYAAHARLMAYFYDVPRVANGVSDDARLGDNVTVGAEPDIAAFVTVGADTTVGDRATFHSGVHVGTGCTIGDDVTLYANVVVYDGCRIGDRVTVHAAAVIGSDGFGYATDGGVHHKIPHAGTAVLEDDVEIGAGCTIDRAVMGETRIGQGSKFDNQVHIAHNVTVGKGCLFAAQVGISGSTRIGDYVVMGGQAGVAGHVKIGDRVQVAGKAGVTKDIADGQTVSGFPARPHREELKAQAAQARIPQIKKRLQRLEQKIKNDK